MLKSWGLVSLTTQCLTKETNFSVSVHRLLLKIGIVSNTHSVGFVSKSPQAIWRCFFMTCHSHPNTRFLIFWSYINDQIWWKSSVANNCSKIIFNTSGGKNSQYTMKFILQMYLFVIILILEYIKCNLVCVYLFEKKRDCSSLYFSYFQVFIIHFP
jgi:hypothetical protein